MAFLELVGSVHIDETHNQRFFLDNDSKLLKPIVWDPVAYYWGNEKQMDLAPNRLFRALLTIPEYRERKNKYMYEAIRSQLSFEELKKIKILISILFKKKN